MKRKLIKFAIGVGILFCLLLTFYGVWAAWENHSGARKWKATREKLIAANVELDFKKLIPDMPRPEDNFASTPLIASLVDFEIDSESESGFTYENPKIRERFQAIKLPEIKGEKTSPDWSSGELANLDAVRKAIAKEVGAEVTILEWMKQFGSEFAEIDAAAKRPFAQLQVDVGETFLDHVNTIVPFYSEFRDYQKVQVIRACAALEAGDTAQARAAFMSSLQLYRSSASHPTLIGFLVGNISLNSSLSIVWQGMKSHQWSAGDLAWIEDQLADVEVLDDLERSLIFEMVTFQMGAGNFLKKVSRKDAAELVKLMGPMGEGNDSSKMGVLALAVPSGVWDHNMSFGCEAMLESIILPIRERRLPEVRAIERLFKERNLRNFLAAMTIPAGSKLAERGFETNAGVDLARLACAVEGFYLKNGSYPDSLESITPDLIKEIPTDLMSEGKPLIYQKDEASGRYRIYSIGADAADDSGKIESEVEETKPKGDYGKGDWVWGYQFEPLKKK